MGLRSKIDTALTCMQSIPSWFALSRRASYLRDSGWLRSRSLGAPRDAQGRPVPWITYPSLFFLEPRVRADMSVFEFGSGSSTLWWASRVRRVVSCEHDQAWFEQVRSTVPASVDIRHVGLEEQRYSREILQYRNEFDIVVIDGRDRINCARNVLTALKEDGIVLWDNSDRDEYRAGYEFLEQNGFRRIDFTGLGPLNVYQWTTSIFYRDRNCLGL
jgi:hypothetical protein